MYLRYLLYLVLPKDFTFNNRILANNLYLAFQNDTIKNNEKNNNILKAKELNAFEDDNEGGFDFDENKINKVYDSDEPIFMDDIENKKANPKDDKNKQEINTSTNSKGDKQENESTNKQDKSKDNLIENNSKTTKENTPKPNNDKDKVKSDQNDKTKLDNVKTQNNNKNITNGDIDVPNVYKHDNIQVKNGEVNIEATLIIGKAFKRSK